MSTAVWERAETLLRAEERGQRWGEGNGNWRGVASQPRICCRPQHAYGPECVSTLIPGTRLCQVHFMSIGTA